MQRRRKLSVLVLIVLLFVVVIMAYYFTRLQTVASVERVTSYSDLNLYKIDVKYAYNLDNVTPYKLSGDEELVDKILREAMPLLPVKVELPKYGCSAFKMPTVDGKILMGRSYDFRVDTSAMLVYCHPKDGYRSIGFAPLANIKINNVDKNVKDRFACLISPFLCVDGMNEKGLSVTILSLDSPSSRPDTGKRKLATTVAIRLMLDRAATTEEAVELLKKYDMYVMAGLDCHYYITDASGNSCAVESDCDDNERKFVVTPTNAITNFYISHLDKVLPYQRNGLYGHGRERYDKIIKVLNENRGNYTQATAWQALQDVAQLPNPKFITSNTQWSVVYNDTDLTAEFALHRRWNDKIKIELESDGIDIDD